MGFLRPRDNSKSLEVLSTRFYVSHVSYHTSQVTRAQMCYVTNSDLFNTQRPLIVTSGSMRKYRLNYKEPAL